MPAIDDLSRWGSNPSNEYWFDPNAANKICLAIENFQHIRGRGFAGKPIKLEPWQTFIYATVFGWRRQDGTRRFRTAYTEIPRKNGKSTMSAPVGLYMLAIDGEPGAEIYSAATTRDQARIIFELAQRMAEGDPEFREMYGVTVHAHAISVLESASTFKPLSAEADTLDGLNIHAALVDELHAHPTRKVWDVLETGMGARTQPLLWAITTAGNNLSGICYEQHSYVQKILNRAARDESYFGIIYGIDTGDDPMSPDTWRKANPNYGISVMPDDVARLATKAAQLPSALSAFLSKRLNVWCQSDNPWMAMDRWHACADYTLRMEDYREDPCWIGLDLAAKTDIASMAILFRHGKDMILFSRHYLPEDAIDQSSNSQYRGWEESKRLITTEGAVTDFETIEDDIVRIVQSYRVQRIGADPNQFAYFGQRLQKRYPNLVYEIPQHVNRLSPGMKELEALVVSGRLRHDGCPVMTWMISNVRAHYPARRSEIFPVKERPEHKIDGAIAAIMAICLALATSNEPPVGYPDVESVVM